MAKYTMDSKPDENGHILTIAKLELDNWSMPQYWEGDRKIPEAWPQAALESLIHLFTGHTADAAQQQGVEICDQLGWHIASLIELWSEHSTPIDHTSLYCDHQTVKNFMYAKYSHENILDMENLIYHETQLYYMERADKIRDVVQRWYRDGIALYQATRP